MDSNPDRYEWIRRQLRDAVPGHSQAAGAALPSQSGGDGRLWGDGLEVEALVNIRVARAGPVVTEVASFEHSPNSRSEQPSAFSEGLRVLRTLGETVGTAARAAVPGLRMVKFMCACPHRFDS